MMGIIIPAARQGIWIPSEVGLLLPDCMPKVYWTSLGTRENIPTADRGVLMFWCISLMSRGLFSIIIMHAVSKCSLQMSNSTC